MVYYLKGFIESYCYSGVLLPSTWLNIYRWYFFPVIKSSVYLPSVYTERRWRHSHLVRSPHMCVGITPGAYVTNFSRNFACLLSTLSLPLSLFHLSLSLLSLSLYPPSLSPSLFLSLSASLTQENEVPWCTEEPNLACWMTRTRPSTKRRKGAPPSHPPSTNYIREVSDAEITTDYPTLSMDLYRANKSATHRKQLIQSERTVKGRKPKDSGDRAGGIWGGAAANVNMRRSGTNVEIKQHQIRLFKVTRNVAMVTTGETTENPEFIGSPSRRYCKAVIRPSQDQDQAGGDSDRHSLPSINSAKQRVSERSVSARSTPSQVVRFAKEFKGKLQHHLHEGPVSTQTNIVSKYQSD
eukprot:sb/3466160/